MPGRFVRVSTKVFSRSIGDPWQQRRHWPQCDSYQENSRSWFFFPPSRSSTPLVCLSRCQMCPKQDRHPHFYSRDGCPILGIFASGTQSSPCRLPPKFPVPVPSSPSPFRPFLAIQVPAWLSWLGPFLGDTYINKINRDRLYSWIPQSMYIFSPFFGISPDCVPAFLSAL